MFRRGVRPGRNFGRLELMKRLLMLMSVATMMATAAPAYADPASDKDADFLKQLTAAGLTYQDPDAAIAVAKDVCDLVDKGTPQSDIEKNLQAQNPSFSGNGVRKFVLLAAAEYCPKYSPSEGGAPKSPDESGPPKPPGAASN